MQDIAAPGSPLPDEFSRRGFRGPATRAWAIPGVTGDTCGTVMILNILIAMKNMSYPILDIDIRSIPVIHEMNEQALPHVNSVTTDYFLAQVSNDSYFRAVYVKDEPVAFLLAMDESADYDSLNFLWFRRHYAEFIYIDRIVVGPRHRRSGLGALLYSDLEEWARNRTPRLACEVNLQPPNEPSLRFHRTLGFVPVGQQETDGGRKTVSLMTRDFDATRVGDEAR